MNYFIEIEGLKELESKEKWHKAKELLYDLWSEDIVSIRYELDYLNFLTKSDYERKQITLQIIKESLYKIVKEDCILSIKQNQ